MPKAPLRYLDPNQFFREFSPELTGMLMARATRTKDGRIPTQNIFCIMRVEEVGKYIQFPIPVGRSTVYELCWLRKGKMTRTVGMVSYDITENNICFWKAGVIKGTEHLSADAEGYYCFFDKDFVLQFLKNQTTLDDLPYFQNENNRLIQLSDEANTSAGELLARIEDEYNSDRIDQQRMLGLLLLQLLISMKRESSLHIDDRTYSAAETLTRQFIQSLRLHVLDQRSVNFYAQQLHVTPNHLNKCIKQTTGRPATFHIAEMTILEAKVRLKQTTQNISEIAVQLGFENFSYFSRVFKKSTLLTPKEYREKYTHPAMA